MTLQEKIDKLPLSIEYNGKEYFLHIENSRKLIALRYCDLQHECKNAPIALAIPCGSILGLSRYFKKSDKNESE